MAVAKCGVRYSVRLQRRQYIHFSQAIGISFALTLFASRLLAVAFDTVSHNVTSRWGVSLLGLDVMAFDCAMSLPGTTDQSQVAH